MAIEDNESSGSRVVDPSPKLAPNQNRLKLEVYNEVLRRIQEFNYAEATLPGFDEQLWLHFDRLPVRYALDVNVEREQDVLAHKRLLDLAQYSSQRFAFEVRPVQVHPLTYENPIDSSIQEDAQSSFCGTQGVCQPPTFASTPNLEFSVLQSNKCVVKDGDSAAHSSSSFARPMHEITFSTVDKPKVLSQLTAMVAEIGLNIQEAHAFSTVDGFSLDVFVVDGWPYVESEQLRVAVENILESMEKSLLKEHLEPVVAGLSHSKSCLYYVKIPSDETDVWEIDVSQLRFENKVGSGTYGDLYKGTYCSQGVAIKVLKPDSINTDMLTEFSQEVYILRKVRHKNVVQFIGACTRSPNLCIVTEFMSKGSVHDFLHKQNGEFELPSLLKVAMDVCKGMNYLHQNNIIHRDLKTANLLMDENDVIKVADFGVARVQAQSGVMTAETGTYRWMAPEVIEHRPYDHKADVFSFGIVLWELLTREVPYASLTPLQAAVGVVQTGLRPAIPEKTHQKVAELLESCWHHEPSQRPNFCEIMELLENISNKISH